MSDTLKCPNCGLVNMRNCCKKCGHRWVTKYPVSKLARISKYRVFISYSHADRRMVEKIADILKENGLQPMWDENFAYGQGFHEQIKKYIAHAHVFLPVLTKTADARKWVHQEIGYAMALNIPVLPIAVGKLPGEMIQQIHALRIKESEIKVLRKLLSKDAIEVLIARHASSSEALYICADLQEDRARMMAAYANDVYELGVRDVVRQKGALSSFHLPTETSGHQIWRRRCGTEERSEYVFRLQRKERLALQRHAEVAGCKLIINPYIEFKQYGADARLCRLECLLQFLNEIGDDHCRVAISNGINDRASITILGNWFTAESQAGSGGKGYQQTIFTRHAPTIMEKIDAFDAELNEILSSAKVKPIDSRIWAIRVISEIVKDVANKVIALK